VPRISIIDLEVFYHVGITDEERAEAQRLLLSVDIEYDFTSAAISGRISRTIDYHAVSQRLLTLGDKRKWKLIETVASDIADKILAEFRPENVAVEVKKFVIPQARYVSVSLTRERHRPQEAEKTWWLRRWY
jgi:7,8-dihydroneopterin aldolase/epimerase/oxygenase